MRLAPRRGTSGSDRSRPGALPQPDRPGHPMSLARDADGRWCRRCQTPCGRLATSSPTNVAETAPLVPGPPHAFLREEERDPPHPGCLPSRDDPHPRACEPSTTCPQAVEYSPTPLQPELAPSPDGARTVFRLGRAMRAPLKSETGLDTTAAPPSTSAFVGVRDPMCRRTSKDACLPIRPLFANKKSRVRPFFSPQDCPQLYP